MYKIFLHLLGLAILEILFYFYYIGPFEHKVFEDSFSNSISGLIKKLDSNYEHPSFIINVNISDIKRNDQVLNELKFSAKESEMEREDYNHELFMRTMSYWIYSFSALLIIMLIHFIFNNYHKIKNNFRENPEIELVELNQSSNDRFEDDSIQMEPKKNRIYIIDILKYLFFGGLVLLFEYLFFKYIVLEYHIITDNQIQYLIYQQMYSYNSDYYIFSN